MKLRVRNIKAIIEAVEELEIRYFEKSITLPKQDEEVIQGYIYRISDILENMGLNRFISLDNNKIIKIKYKEIKPQIKQLQKQIENLINYLELIITKYQNQDIKECYERFIKQLKEVLEICISALKPLKKKDIQKNIITLSDEIVELLEIVKEKKDFEILDIAMDKISIFYSLSYDLERL